MITDVAIDLDGVLYPFSREFHTFCSKALGAPDLPHAKHWHFYEDWGLSENEYNHLLLEAVHAGVFIEGRPPLSSRTVWGLLKMAGIRIHIITARPPEAWADTTWWLQEHGLLADSLHFTDNKALFSGIVGNGMGMMLDDAPKYLQSVKSCANVIPVAFDQPWNRDFDCLRTQTLLGFSRLVELYNRQEEEKW